VKSLDGLDVLPQGWGDCLGKHGEPILVAFRSHNCDFAAIEVHILDSQTEGFVQPEAASIKKLANQGCNPIEFAEQPLHFSPRQNNRAAGGAASPQNPLYSVVGLAYHHLEV
jgi:hypothetical protein